MRQTSVKWSPGEPEPTFALTSPQITLCCRLLHRRGYFSRNPVELMVRRSPSLSGATDSVGLAAQEGGDVEQIVFLAQIRPVVRLQRSQPGLRVLLGGWLRRLDGRARRGLRRDRTGTAHPGHPLDEAGDPPFRLGRAVFGGGWNGGLSQRNRSRGPGIRRFRCNERTVAHCRA